MSEYIVSARKYRPTRFDEVVGQQALTTTLKNAVKSGKLAHAYLFCGPRGVGKTTCARIFAKAINCLHPTADGEACGECESCKAMEEQRSLNIFELDAASNNSVEHIKTLMEQTRIPPQTGRYKVFIIDEVHMLSTAAFNAFLKTLEEPPVHVVFILATTEKHKILPTIISRCQIYDFERMGAADIINHLKSVAAKENIPCEEEALRVIAEKADGGMRDALSLFDQAASFCQGAITYKKIIEDLNVPDADCFFRMVDLCIGNDAGSLMLLLNDMMQRGFEGGQLMTGLAKHVRNVMMARDAQTLTLVDASEQHRQRLGEQAKRCPTQFLVNALKILNNCDVNYKQSSNKRLLVELSLIEMSQLTQPDDAEPVAGRKPYRLKTLFRNLERKQRHHDTAKQVAAKPVSPRDEEEKDERPESPFAYGRTITPNKPRSPQARPKLAMSWASLREQSLGKSATQAAATPADDTNAADKPFDDDQLQLQWMAMCNRMPQKLSGIASRMKNMTPKIKDFPTVEIVADNQIIIEQMTPLMGSITEHLRALLENSHTTIVLRMAQPSESAPVMTRRQLFDTMAKENPAVEKLRQSLDLELA